MFQLQDGNQESIKSLKDIDRGCFITVVIPCVC